MVDDYAKKVVLLGDGAVGKTSLVKRFVHSTFGNEYIQTIGVVPYVKHVQTEKNNFKFLILDIAGQNIRTEVNEAYIKGADGTIIVMDETRRSTAEHIVDYVGMLRKNAGDVPVVLVFNKHDVMSQFEEYSGLNIRQVKLESLYKKKFNVWMHAMNPGMISYYEKNYPAELERLFDMNCPFFDPITDGEMRRFESVIQRMVKQKVVPIHVSSAKTGANVEEAFKSLAELLV